MRDLFHQLRADETGLVISAELVIVATVGVLAMVVGLETASSAVIQELNDLAGAFGSMSQSFNYRSVQRLGHAYVSGTSFHDWADYCDRVAISRTDVVGQSLSERESDVGRGLPPKTSMGVGDVLIERPSVIERQAARDDADGAIIEERIIRRHFNAESDDE